MTDPDVRAEGLSVFVLGGLMESHREKAHLVTTVFNRNMIRFPRDWKRGLRNKFYDDIKFTQR